MDCEFRLGTPFSTEACSHELVSAVVCPKILFLPTLEFKWAGRALEWSGAAWCGVVLAGERIQQTRPSLLPAKRRGLAPGGIAQALHHLQSHTHAQAQAHAHAHTHAHTHTPNTPCARPPSPTAPPSNR